MGSKKRIRIAIGMVVLLSGISFWIVQNNNKGTLREDMYEFAIEDTSGITKIYMANSAGKEITLEKQKPGSWTVNRKFTARNDAVKNLLTCMKDMAVRQPVAKSAIENVSKQLATNSTKVEIYRGEKLERVYYVGGDTQDGLGTFMLLSDPETGENSPTPFVMFIPGFNGFLSVRYFMDEDLWRDRTVFNFYPDEIASIKIEYPYMPDSSFTVSLTDNNDVSVADSKGKTLRYFDTLKVKRYITYYTNIQYEALENKRRKTFLDSVLSNKPVHIITLKERTGEIHTVKTYAKPAEPGDTDPVTGQPRTEDLERMFAQINDGKDIALIQYYVFGKLFMGLSYFQTPTSLDQAVGVKK